LATTQHLDHPRCKARRPAYPGLCRICLRKTGSSALPAVLPVRASCWFPNYLDRPLPRARFTNVVVHITAEEGTPVQTAVSWSGRLHADPSVSLLRRHHEARPNNPKTWSACGAACVGLPFLQGGRDNGR